MADVDGDGWEDVYVTRLGKPNSLFLNECGERFVDVAEVAGVAAEGFSSNAVFADVDTDGDLDLFVGSLIDDQNKLFINHGDLTFGDEAEARGLSTDEDERNLTFGASFGDIDDDGDLDLVVAAWQPVDAQSQGRSRVYRNDGQGNFTDSTSASGLDLSEVAGFTATIADFTADGIPDITLAADWGTSKLLVGEGNGRFRKEAAAPGDSLPYSGMGSAVADFDGDSDLDWFVTAISRDPMCETSDGADDRLCSGNRLYRNEGGALVDVTVLFGVADGEWELLSNPVDGVFHAAVTSGGRSTSFPSLNCFPSRTC